MLIDAVARSQTLTARRLHWGCKPGDVARKVLYDEGVTLSYFKRWTKDSLESFCATLNVMSKVEEALDELMKPVLQLEQQAKETSL